MQFGFEFYSTEALEQYDTKEDSVIGYRNKNFVVDIQIVPFGHRPEVYYQDVRKAARFIAAAMELDDITDMKEVPSVEHSFYVLAYEEQESLRYPVYVIIIIDHSKKISYEATIDCFNKSLVKGMQMASSFRLL